MLTVLPPTAIQSATAALVVLRSSSRLPAIETPGTLTVRPAAKVPATPDGVISNNPVTWSTLTMLATSASAIDALLTPTLTTFAPWASTVCSNANEPAMVRPRTVMLTPSPPTRRQGPARRSPTAPGVVLTAMEMREATLMLGTLTATSTAALPAAPAPV